MAKKIPRKFTVEPMVIKGVAVCVVKRQNGGWYEFTVLPDTPENRAINQKQADHYERVRIKQAIKIHERNLKSALDRLAALDRSSEV